MNLPFIKEVASLPKKVQSWVVPDSPFNQIKMLLAIFMVGGGLIWLIGDILIDNVKEQVLFLAIYTASASLLTIFKTYQYLRHYEKVKK